jgi:purine-nucleoside phosphorylase
MLLAHAGAPVREDEGGHVTELQIALPKALEPHRGTIDVAVVLGSGFGGLVDSLEEGSAYRYTDLEGYPNPSAGVPGHAGTLFVGKMGGHGVALFAGRVHAYQGLSALDAAWTARMTAALGAPIIVLTNAAGGLAEHLYPGDVVLIEDHVNLTGMNPLVGWPGPEGGVPFVPMRDAYDPQLRALALEVAAEQGVTLHPGVYIGLLGPSFETVAEVSMFRQLGGDVVGMSTVLETIAARALGVRVLAFSLVSNAAAGVGLSHEEVLETGKRVEAEMAGLLREVVERL